MRGLINVMDGCRSTHFRFDLQLSLPGKVSGLTEAFRLFSPQNLMKVSIKTFNRGNGRKPQLPTMTTLGEIHTQSSNCGGHVDNVMI